MSLIIRLAGVTLGDTGLPTLRRTVQGFPSEGLQGLYLMADGTIGASHSGTFADASGAGNTAARRGDWAAPTRQAYGMAGHATYGLCVQTPIAVTPSLTWVYVGRHGAATSGNGYPGIVGPSGGIQSAQAGSAFLDRDFYLNYDLSGGGNDIGVFNGGHSADPWPSGATPRAGIPQTAGYGDDAMVIGVSFNNTTGVCIAKTLRPSSRLEITGLAGERNEWAGSTETVCFGQWRYAATGAVPGDTMLFAAYNTALSESDLDTAMQAARAIVQARGVAVVTT